MKRTLSFSFILVIVAFLFTGCGKLNEPTPQMQGQLYTTVNMWEEKNKSIATNYARGRLIPVNSEVIILGFSSKVIAFTIAGEGGQEIQLINIPKFTKLDTQSLVKRMFSSKKTSLSRFSRSEREAIELGIIKNGMSKDSVIVARGYPPMHVTPNLKSNVWKYWQNRFVTRNVMFKNNRVTGLAGWGTGSN